MADRNPLPPVVLEALRRGDKVVAIKLLREMTKLGLAEAKGMIDALEAHQKAQGTAKPPSPTNVHGGMQHHAHAVAQRRPREDDLGPGEVPRSTPFGGIAIMIAVAAIVLGVWLYSKVG
jgi:hypothetical protein